MLSDRLTMASVMLALSACSTQAPPPLAATHPAHAAAAAGSAPDTGAPSALSGYRDFSPAARTAPAPTTPASEEEPHAHPSR